MVTKVERSVIFAALLICFFASRLQFDIWRWQWLAGMFFSAACLSFYFFKRFSPSIGLAWLTAALSGICIWAHPDPLIYTVQAKWNSATTFGYFAMVSLSVALYPQEWHKTIVKGIWVGLLSSAAFLCIRKILGLPANSIIGNAAADGSLIACLAPFLIWWNPNKKFRIAAAMLVLATLILSESSTALAAAALSMGSYEILTRRPSLKHLLTIGAVGAVCSGAVLYFMRESFFNDNGRFRIWRISFQYWRDHLSHTIGSGIGQYFPLSVKIQCQQNSPCRVFYFQHNEIMQTLFEQGTLGLIMNLNALRAIFLKAFDRTWLISSLLGYTFMACFQYPLRFYVPAFIGAVLVRESFDNKK